MEPIVIKYKFKDQLELARKHSEHVFNNELAKLSNLKVYRDDSASIQSIFATYWDSFKLHFEDKLRPSIIENVEKMIHCRDFKYGYFFYECPTCDNFHIQGLSCHSRFCPSCNQKYREARTLAIESKLLKCPHRHFVFSIATEMRKFFWLYRDLFDILFQTVNEVLHKAVKKTKADLQLDRRLGIICFLHTYGRDMKTNPHIHALVAERFIDANGHISSMSFFPFERLRMFWQFRLLNNISAYLKIHGTKSIYNEFNRLRSYLIHKYKKGFYTYGPQLKRNSSLSTAKKIAKYIARYASHPAIAESRIDDFDDINHQVTWHFDPHEDDQIIDKHHKRGRQVITDHVFKFIARLIKHIPDKGFHLIRYYGFYSNRTKRKFAPELKLISPNSIAYLKRQLHFRALILKTYHYDVFMCQCGSTMVLNLDASYLPNHRKERLFSDA
jgi:hypothetical protein